MGSQIKELQEKYWAGKTTVEEERILKEYFGKKESTETESLYFNHLKRASEQKPDRAFWHPGRKIGWPRWLMAAAITVGILAGAYLVQIYQKQNAFLVEDPQQALEITRQALMTISSGMNKGTVYVDNLQKFDEATIFASRKTQTLLNNKILFGQLSESNF